MTRIDPRGLPWVMRFLASLALLAACNGSIEAGDGDGSPGPGRIDAGPFDPDAGVPDDRVDAGDGPLVIDAAPPADVVVGACGDTSGDRKTLVCRRWRCDREDLSEGAWSGSVDRCQAADSPSDGRDNALRLVNLYRFMAELPPVTTDAGKNQRAQDCALMMDANNALSHDPPESWKCFSDSGRDGAGTSNIASAAGVKAVDMYMNDFGNETTMGHRRWLLSNSLGPIGLGSTSGASCALVLGGQGDAERAWTAWPPPGPFPIEAFSEGGFGQTIDETGWTVQSDQVNLDAATVTVTDGGASRPVKTSVLLPGYGSSKAIRFVPDGWEAQVGHTYQVTLGNVSVPINYQVEVTDCP
jgi:hypothetical protein